MTSPSSEISNSKQALNNFNESIKKLRETLRESLAKFKVEHNNESASGNGHGSTTKKEKNQTDPIVIQALVQTTMAKLAHDSIIRNVDQSRQQLRKDQDDLMRHQLKLDSLQYESHMLRSQIESLQKKSSGEAIQKLGMQLPSSNAVLDDENAHSQFEQTLQEELKRRKRIRKEVDQVTKETYAKRRKLDDMKSKLREVPRAVRQLNDLAKPIYSLLDIKGLDSNSEEFEAIRKLPRPLYVLGREAISFKHVYPNRINVTVFEAEEGEDVSSTIEDEANQDEDIYNMYPAQVRIDINDPLDSKKGYRSQWQLRVLFGYHPKLDIVTVSSEMLLNGDKDGRHFTKDLQLLYPYDTGEKCPNPVSEHLEDGRFEFDSEKIGGRRAYVWANLICNITCMESFEKKDKNDDDKSQFYLWPQKAVSFRNNIQFRTVVEALEERLRSIVSLQEQLDNLVKKKIVVTAKELGLGEEQNGKITDFIKLPRQSEDDQGRQNGTHDRYTEVWSMVLEVERMTFKCMIGIEPDYPSRPPVFRIVCEKMAEGMLEGDVTELEQCVNEFHLQENSLVSNELLLSAQVVALMVYARRLALICKKLGEGSRDVQNVHRLIGSGWKSKRAAMLSNDF